MDRIKDHKHPQSGIFNLLSLLFEQISYFGIRSVLVIYLIEGLFQYDRSASLSIYATYTTSIFFGSIIGGLLGDRIFGNRKAVIYGGFLQAIGAYSLCIPSEPAFYVGLVFIVIGGSLYSPNILVNIGKSYLSKPQLMDSGFTMSFGVRTAGAFIGTFLIMHISELSFTVAFVTAGTSMIISTLFILLNKHNKPEPIKAAAKPKTKRTRNVLLIILAFGVFYAFYRLYEVPSESLNISFFDEEANLIPGFIRSYLEFIIELIIIIVLAAFWTFYRYSRKIKLLTAAVSVIIASLFILLIPNEELTHIHLVLFIIHLLFMTFAHLQVEPIIYSLIMRHGNPKYYATLLILIKIPPSFLYTFLYFFIIEQISSYYTVASIAIGMIGMFIYAGIVYYFMKFLDKNNSPERLAAYKRQDNELLDS